MLGIHGWLEARASGAEVCRLVAPLLLTVFSLAWSSCAAPEDSEIAALRERVDELEAEATAKEDVVRRYERIRTELDPRGPGPAEEAGGLRDEANRVDESEVRTPQAEGEPEPHPCWGNVLTLVRAEQGTSCETYAAEIGGWSEHCVDECDDAARLAEAVADARATCAAFCRSKGCPGPRYAPPDTCAAAECLAGLPDCQAEWPLLNTCFLLQEKRVWNCVCVEI